MRVVFMGTPDFAAPTLEALHASVEHSVVAVFTQPDRPKGRGKKIAYSPIKEIAIKYDLPCYQPEKIRKNEEILDILKTLQPDVIVVVAYGQILPKSILDLAPYGCINVHSSLLPELRGAAPIHWAIYQGKKETGVTTMCMDAGLDTGDILLKSKKEITPNMTMGELHDLLKIDGASLLLQTLDGLKKQTLERQKQDETLSSYAPLIHKEDEVIDWNRSARELHNQVRAFNPWPGSYTYFKGSRLKIWTTLVLEDDSFSESSNPPGTVRVEKNQVIVSAGKGSLILTEVQPQSKSKIQAIDWAHGQKIAKEIFENDTKDGK